MKKTQLKKNLKMQQPAIIIGVLVFLLMGVFAWLYVSKVQEIGAHHTQVNKITKSDHAQINQKNSDPKLIAVPLSLRGTWYYYSDVRGRQNLEKIKLTTHMVRNSMIFDSRQIAKKFRHPDMNVALHKLQNQYPDALEGVIKKEGKHETLLVYDLLDKENARELFYVKDNVLQIISDGKVTKAYATSEQAKKHLPKNSVLIDEDDDLDMIFY